MQGIFFYQTLSCASIISLSAWVLFIPNPKNCFKLLPISLQRKKEALCLCVCEEERKRGEVFCTALRENQIYLRNTEVILHLQVSVDLT